MPEFELDPRVGHRYRASRPGNSDKRGDPRDAERQHPAAKALRRADRLGGGGILTAICRARAAGTLHIDE